ncbi:MAG TPA: antibiotic biosynthesis monooxygenase [Chitinophagaceae bacterium]|jgi:heme-degrading monooxygenase HmoA|nr:antibiotic biosynthesis monooxygenase [Chitinophagaceae bacterium]
MTDHNSNSVEIIRYNIPGASHASFEQAYTMGGKLLEASPYCTGYHINKGDDEPDNYIVTIYWTSKDDHLTKFRTSEQFTGFFKFVKPFFNNIQEMKHYHPPLVSWSKS